MSWGLWVHAGDVAKEGVPALLDEVSNVGKACTTSDVNVLDFTQPVHTEDTSLTARVEHPRFRGLPSGSSPPWSRAIEQHGHDECHVQT